MKVALDASSLASNGRGFARYVQVLLEGFAALPNPGIELLLYSDAPLPSVPFGIPRILPPRRIHSLWRRRDLVTAARRDGAVLLHFPDNEIAPCHPMKAVSTVHGIAPLVLPERRLISWPMRLYFKTVLAAIARHADTVIAVSERDREDLAAWWGAPVPRLRRVYSGISALPRLPREEARPPYFLFVGALDAVKNLPHLLEAFARFKAATGLPHRLVLVGGLARGFGVRGVDPGPLLAASPVSGDILFMGALPVGDAKLAGLYARASALVLVSWYETFGFPYLEAWAAGCPVIGTTAGAGPEIIGDAGLLADPADPAAIAAAMERLARDEALGRDLAARGRERLKRFTATGMAEATLDVYREALAR